MNNIIPIVKSHLYYTQGLWSPISLSFIASTFIVGLVLVGILYLLPLYFKNHFAGINRYPMLKDSIFIISYGWIYMYWLSNKWHGISELTYREFYCIIIIFYLIFLITFLVRRTHLLSDYIGVLSTYIIGFGMVVLGNLLFKFLDIYFV